MYFIWLVRTQTLNSISRNSFRNILLLSLSERMTAARMKNVIMNHLDAFELTQFSGQILVAHGLNMMFDT